MPTTDFEFANDAGQQLSGTLEIGAGGKAYAIFSHCYEQAFASFGFGFISRSAAVAKT